jgi:hypothetical protein
MKGSHNDLMMACVCRSFQQSLLELGEEEARTNKAYLEERLSKLRIVGIMLQRQVVGSSLAHPVPGVWSCVSRPP